MAMYPTTPIAATYAVAQRPTTSIAATRPKQAHDHRQHQHKHQILRSQYGQQHPPSTSLRMNVESAMPPSCAATNERPAAHAPKTPTCSTDSNPFAALRHLKAEYSPAARPASPSLAPNSTINTVQYRGALQAQPQGAHTGAAIRTQGNSVADRLVRSRRGVRRPASSLARLCSGSMALKGARIHDQHCTRQTVSRKVELDMRRSRQLHPCNAWTGLLVSSDDSMPISATGFMDAGFRLHGMPCSGMPNHSTQMQQTTENVQFDKDPDSNSALDSTNALSCVMLPRSDQSYLTSIPHEMISMPTY